MADRRRFKVEEFIEERGGETTQGELMKYFSDQVSPAELARIGIKYFEGQSRYKESHGLSPARLDRPTAELVQAGLRAGTYTWLYNRKRYGAIERTNDAKGNKATWGITEKGRKLLQKD